MVAAIAVLCENMILYEDRWDLLEKFQAINNDLKRHFKVYYAYHILYRYLRLI